MAYLRQSVDRTGDELGVTRQREDCERLAAARGWTIARVITDNDTSASKGHRTGFAEVLRMVDDRAVDVVVVWAVDRLVRKMADLEDVIERCERAGVRLATVSGDVDLSTDAGRLVARILASVARAEVERKGARQRRAYMQAAELGKPPGGPVPFGFLANRVTHHPVQAVAIRDAYAALIEGGTLAGIARRWNAAGLTSGRVRTGRGRVGQPSQWHATTVRAVLIKPRNAGLRALNGEIIGPAKWEPIVDEATYRAAVDLLASRRQALPSGRRYLLSGIASCGVCGGPVCAGTILPAYHTYRCSSNGHVARRGDHVDEYVSATVVEWLSRSDAIDLLTDDAGPDVAAVRVEASGLRARLKSVAEDFADGTLTDSQLRTITARLRARLEEAEAQLAEAGRVNVLASLVAVALADPDAAPSRVRAAWDTMMTDGVDRCRAVVAALMSVTVHPPGAGARRFDPATVQISRPRDLSQ